VVAAESVFNALRMTAKRGSNGTGGTCVNERLGPMAGKGGTGAGEGKADKVTLKIRADRLFQ